jgi:hypothetical protein
MSQNRKKWSKIGQKIAENWSKMLKIGQKCLKNAKNSQRRLLFPPFSLKFGRL